MNRETSENSKIFKLPEEKLFQIVGEEKVKSFRNRWIKRNASMEALFLTGQFI